jgi:Uma2 family endonuclease
MAIFPQQSHMTVEEYFELCRSDPDTRYEYIDGQVTMLAGGSLNHARIAANINGALRNLLRGGPCQAFTSDAALRVTASRYVLPDIAVTCDERDHQDNDYLQYPSLLFEILSPSTERADRGRKFTYYRNIPTIREYVLVDSLEVSVELFRREETKFWTLHFFGLDDEIALASIGVTLSVREIYENVVFSQEQ